MFDAFLPLLGLGLLGLIVLGPIGGILGIRAYSAVKRLREEVSDLRRQLAQSRMAADAASPPAAASRPGPATPGPAAPVADTPAGPAAAAGHPSQPQSAAAPTTPTPVPQQAAGTEAPPPPAAPDHRRDLPPRLPPRAPTVDTMLARPTPPRRTPSPIAASSLSAPPAPATTARGDERTGAAGPNWEWLLGTRGLSWVGVATLFLSFAFLLRYAIGEGWIGPEMRLGAVVVAGGALLGGGWWALRRGMLALGQGLLGGGLASWYLAVCAALKPGLLVVDTAMIQPLPAFALLALLVAAGLAMALRWNMQPISLVALIGGLAAPLLTSSGAGDQHALFGYLLLLDLGVIAAAVYRRWRALDAVAFLGTVLLFAGWHAAYYPAAGAPWSTVAWLAGFYTAFLVLPFLPHWRDRSPVSGERFGMALGNLAFGLGYGALLLARNHDLALAVGCLLAAIAYQLLQLVTLRRCGDDGRIRHGFTALSVMLLALFLLYLLPVNAVATGWAIEAVLLVAVGYRFAQPTARLLAAALWGLAVVRTLWQLPTVEPGAAWLLHVGALHLAVLPATAVAIAAIHRRWVEPAAAVDRLLASGFAAAAALGLCMIGWWDWQRLAIAHGGDGLWGWDQWRWAAVAAIPTLVAALSLALDRRWPWPTLRVIAGLGWGIGLAVAVLAAWLQPPAWPLLGPRSVAGLAACAGLAWLAVREDRQDFRILAILAPALLLGVDLARWFGHGLPLPGGGAWLGLGWLVAVPVLLRLARRRRHLATVLAAAGCWWAATGMIALSYLVVWPEALPLLNLRALAAGAALGLLAWSRSQLRDWPEAEPIRHGIPVVLGIGGWLLASTEIPLYCWQQLEDPQAARLSLTLCWLAYAALLLGLGFARRLRPARLAALALFGLATAKLVFVDLADSGTLVRIASFCATGLVLIAASWVYHRLERLFDPEAAAPAETDAPSAAVEADG